MFRGFRRSGTSFCDRRCRSSRRGIPYRIQGRSRTPLSASMECELGGPRIDGPRVVAHKRACESTIAQRNKCVIGRMVESTCERGDATPLHPTATIVAKYQWNLEELTKAIRSHSRHSTRPLFRAAFWLLAIVFCMFGGIIAVQGSILGGAFVGALGLLWMIISAAEAPWRARRQFRQNPNQNGEIEWRFSAESIQCIGPHSSTQADWGAVFKVAEAPDGLLFYFGPQFFHWIPKNSFASEAEFQAAAELAMKNCQTFIKLGGSIFQGFRFRVRNLLWATFWVCIWAAALSHLLTFIPNHRPLQDLSWWVLLAAVWIPLLIVVWTPAIAIGALFNHTQRGVLVGLIFVAVLIVLIIAVII